MEEWKNDILNSLEGMEKAQPPANAFLKIQNRISNQQATKPYKDKSWLPLAAAISLIVITNVFFVSDYLQKPSEDTSAAYPTIISSYILY
ncbi:MAG: hypothetical protein ACFB15_18505 [Cyclobacteriaceae bacterium]